MEAFDEVFKASGVVGRFVVELPSGKRLEYGQPPAEDTAGAGVDIAIRVKDERFFEHTIASGNLGLGESFIWGWFEFTRGSVVDLMRMILVHRIDEGAAGHLSLRHKLAAFRTLISYRLRGQHNNIKAHYDILDTEFWRCMLGEYMMYTCGFVELGPDGTMDEKSLDLDLMQRNKLDRICRKLRLRPGQRVLDMGCGFGGFSIYAAKHYGVECVGFSLSELHARVAQEQAVKHGVADKCKFHNAGTDFMNTLPAGSFDALAEIGLMEHIQMNYYKEIFDNVHRVLKPDGIGLFHSIGSHERPNRHDHFIQKYIFPDSRTLLLSDLAIELETRKMPVQDVEDIGRHYHYTLMAWRRNSQRYFDAHPGKVPEEFQRLWVYYLESLAAYSLWGDGVLFHTVFYNSSRCPRPFNRVV